MLLSKTYYVSATDVHPHQIDLRSISDLNEVLLDTYNGIQKVESGDEILFKSGETFYGQINLSDRDGKNVNENLTFSTYLDTKSLLPPPAIIDGSVVHFPFDKTIFDSEEINGTTFYKYVIQTDVNGNIDGTNIPLPKKILNVYTDTEQLILAREPEAEEHGGGVTLSSKHDLPAPDPNFDGYYGYYSIDEITSSDPEAYTFTDAYNSRSWQTAQVILRPFHWNYELNIIDKFSSVGNYILRDKQSNSLNETWGYFIQDHYDALDTEKEWYYDAENKTLYFSPGVDECDIYLTAYDVTNINSHGFGIYIDNKSNYTITNLDFRNQHSNILVSSAYASHSTNITIDNNILHNSVYGINYKGMSSSVISNNIIENIRSFGIAGDNGHQNHIHHNTIENVGLTLGSEKWNFNWGSGGANLSNLSAIFFRGQANIIEYNIINNIGYVGIHLGEDHGLTNVNGNPNNFSVEANNIIHENTISNTGQSLTDAGGIYTYHNWGTGNVISDNKVSYCEGNNNGTTSRKYGQRGIYLDMLSNNITITGNEIHHCGSGIFLQNSRNNIITGNKCWDNYNEQIWFQNSGHVMNGGQQNPCNDIDYDPLNDIEAEHISYVNNVFPNSSNVGKYYFDQSWNDRIMRYCYSYIGSDNTVRYAWKPVYVEFHPTDINGIIYGNEVYENEFAATSSVGHLSSKEEGFNTMRFQTWKEVNDETLYNYTQNNNPISDNIVGNIEDVTLFISSCDVWEYDNFTKELQGTSNVGKFKLNDLENDNELNQINKLRCKIILGCKYNHNEPLQK